jgi:hypothetical protein
MWKKFGFPPLERGDDVVFGSRALKKTYIDCFSFFFLYRTGKNPFVVEGPVLTIEQSFVRDYDYEDLMRSQIVLSFLAGVSPIIDRKVSFGKKRVIVRSTLRGFRFFSVVRQLSILAAREQDIMDMIKRGGISDSALFFSLKDVGGYFNLGFSKVDFFGWKKSLEFRLDFSRASSVDFFFLSIVGLNFIELRTDETFNF